MANDRRGTGATAPARMSDDPGRPASDGHLPPAAQPPTRTLATVARLARAEPLSAELLAALDGPLGAAVDLAAAFAGDALAPSTRRAYARDWRAFAAWCRGKDAPLTLPAHPVLVAAYLADLAPRLGRSALAARLAAIAHHHARLGHTWSTSHPAIRATMRGIGRAHGIPVRPSAALTSAELRMLVESCGDDLPGLRDRALLLLGLAGALRRSELVAIDRDRLRFQRPGLLLHIAHSKTDQEGEGATLSIPAMAGALTCPVRAVERWLERAGIAYGPVFQRISARGALEGRLGTDAVRRILLRRAGLAGLTVDPGERLSPHGLRAGFITEAYLAGAPDEQVMAHTRHQDLRVMQGYRRRAKITRENPARLLDL